MTTYLGTDLLLIRPNSLTAFPSDASRPLRQAANDVGNVLTETTTAPAATTHELEWICETRAQRTAIRAVLDARLGTTVPLWIPTYRRDIDVLAVDTFWIKVPTAAGGASIGALLSANPGWQHWFQWPPTSAYRIRQFTSATDNGDGTTKWNGTAQTGTDSDTVTSANGRIFSRLMFCRLADESYRVRVLGTASVVSAAFLEVPAEAPS